MSRLLIIAQETRTLAGLNESLTRSGFACSITPYGEAMEIAARQSPDLVLVEIDGHLPGSRTWKLIQNIKREKHLPTIALVSKEKLDSIDGQLDVDDFLTDPYDTKELALRINRLIRRTGNTDGNELIKCDGLVIDPARCEVTIDGRVVELTFKEYELLKFLAASRGRVYNRQTLLDKVWGYDYYGGDRTVDVHVRRLRSKIEDSNHTFIETVRNVGYRFRTGTQ